MTDTALMTAKQCFQKTATLELPQGFAIGSWWRMLQARTRERITQFVSAEEAIHYAQMGRVAFDPRLMNCAEASQVINFKLKELVRIFPQWSLRASSLGESPHSHPNSLVACVSEASPSYSTSFLAHLAYYLRSTQVVGRRAGRARTRNRRRLRRFS